jgi:hypothetical protein
MARIFGKALELFLRVERRPVEDEAEFFERWVVRERAQQRENAVEVVVNLESRAQGIIDNERLVLRQEADFIAARKVGLGVETVRQAQVARPHRLIRQRHFAIDG